MDPANDWEYWWLMAKHVREYRNNAEKGRWAYSLSDCIKTEKHEIYPYSKKICRQWEAKNMKTKRQVIHWEPKKTGGIWMNREKKSSADDLKFVIMKLISLLFLKHLSLVFIMYYLCYVELSILSLFLTPRSPKQEIWYRWYKFLIDPHAWRLPITWSNSLLSKAFLSSLSASATSTG